MCHQYLPYLQWVILILKKAKKRVGGEEKREEGRLEDKVSLGERGYGWS